MKIPPPSTEEIVAALRSGARKMATGNAGTSVLDCVPSRCYAECSDAMQRLLRQTHGLSGAALGGVLVHGDLEWMREDLAELMAYAADLILEGDAT